MDDMDIIKSTINKTEYQENAFYIADISEVIKKHEEWLVKLPRVIPKFLILLTLFSILAIKVNSNPMVIKVLAALNACFDCASAIVQESDAYARGIALCKQLVTVSKAIEYDKVQLIDIGGRFPGERGTDIDKINFISEPGRYYVISGFTLTSYLHSKRIVLKNGEMIRIYYINYGVFNSFFDEMMGFLGAHNYFPILIFNLMFCIICAYINDF
ncbi:DCOR decarboxylase, partial [Acromyrmex insinuator]